MSETPDPTPRRRLTRASVIGGGLGIAGIGLFILFWIALGNIGADPFSRLVISVCAPPALIALAVGVYFLVVRPRNDT